MLDVLIGIVFLWAVAGVAWIANNIFSVCIGDPYPPWAHFHAETYMMLVVGTTLILPILGLWLVVKWVPRAIRHIREDLVKNRVDIPEAKVYKE